MERAIKNPLWKPSSIFLIALSLSMGWGMRGNFGHESGAWIPGALAAMAIAILSQREDWRQRVHFFALFGGLGLGFGGSISYMYAISFTMSGHLPSIWYGYLLTFFEGALWCGLGGAGMALAATAKRERLTGLIVPMCYVIVALVVHKLIEEPVARLLNPPAAEAMDAVWHRQKSPLYWFDADWFSALMAFLGVCVYDLVSRARDKAFPLSAAILVMFLVGGAALGFLVQTGVRAVGVEDAITNALNVPLGDPAAINPETGIAYGDEIDERTEAPYGLTNFLTNWPQPFSDYPQHVGWVLGLLIGWTLYFLIFGKWYNDSGLFLYMSLGWLVSFMLFPVLGTALLYHIGMALREGGSDVYVPLFGGFRLMPPRSDDWAGIFGVFVAAILYCMRKGWKPVALGASLSALIGGIMFATMQLIRSLLVAPGNQFLNDGTTPPEWAHYQSANWHSFLEQSQGFGHGMAFAVTAAVLWSVVKTHKDEPRVRPWTEIFAVAFVLLFMVYANLYKNVAQWTGGGKPLVPESMKPPLIAELFTGPENPVTFSALTWFNLVWIAAGAALIGLMIAHLRGRRVEIVPSSWVGKGQLLYVLVLWGMVIGNFERALPGFAEGRLITEWVIFINAALATFLLGYLPRPTAETLTIEEPEPFRPRLGKVWAIGLPVAIVLMTLYTGIIRGVYGDASVGHPDLSHKRFGPEAVWAVKPILKEGKHR